MEDLIDSLWLQEIAQAVSAEIFKSRTYGESATRQLLGSLSDQDLPAMTNVQHASQPIEGRGQVVAPFIRRRFSRMQRHPHPQCPGTIRPGFGEERALHGDGSAHRVLGGSKGGLRAIADGLVEHAVMGGDE